MKAVDGANNDRARDNLFQEEGLKRVPGIRLSDATEAGRWAYVVDKGEATQEQFDEWIAQAGREGRIKKPGQKVPEKKPLTQPKKATPKPIGKNADGEDICEDEQGVRHLLHFIDDDDVVLQSSNFHQAVKTDPVTVLFLIHLPLFELLIVQVTVQVKLGAQVSDQGTSMSDQQNLLVGVVRLTTFRISVLFKFMKSGVLDNDLANGI